MACHVGVGPFDRCRIRTTLSAIHLDAGRRARTTYLATVLRTDKRTPNCPGTTAPSMGRTFLRDNCLPTTTTYLHHALPISQPISQPASQPAIHPPRSSRAYSLRSSPLPPCHAMPCFQYRDRALQRTIVLSCLLVTVVGGIRSAEFLLINLPTWPACLLPAPQAGRHERP